MGVQPDSGSTDPGAAVTRPDSDMTARMRTCGLHACVQELQHGFLGTFQSLYDTLNTRMIGSVRHCLAGLNWFHIAWGWSWECCTVWQARLAVAFPIPVAHGIFFGMRLSGIRTRCPVHQNCACKRSASLPEILQVCSTSTLVVRSCHLIPAIFHKQRGGTDPVEELGIGKESTSRWHTEVMSGLQLDKRQLSSWRICRVHSIPQAHTDTHIDRHGRMFYSHQIYRSQYCHHLLLLTWVISCYSCFERGYYETTTSHIDTLLGMMRRWVACQRHICTQIVRGWSACICSIALELIHWHRAWFVDGWEIENIYRSHSVRCCWLMGYCNALLVGGWEYLQITFSEELRRLQRNATATLWLHMIAISMFSVVRPGRHCRTTCTGNYLYYWWYASAVRCKVMHVISSCPESRIL